MTRSPRLAELVMHLTDCAPRRAAAAVAAAADKAPGDDPLAIVARAMCSVRRVDVREPVDLRDRNQVSAQ